MLITDYSSVSWDVYYQEKPVVFYPFDLETYEDVYKRQAPDWMSFPLRQR